jgi:hypothetical protein
MKLLKIMALSAAIALSCGADAKGGFSGGGGRGGFSSGSRSFSTPSAPSYSRPAMPAPSVQQSRPNSTPTVMPGVNNRPPVNTQTSQARPPTTTSTTTTSTTQTSRVGPGVSYGGMGMGYGYYGTSGLLTGLIIGSMMHPHGTTVYTGSGAHNALQYPNGQIVDQNGKLIGTSHNGTFVPVTNGPIVAQQAPTDAHQQPTQQQVMVVQKAPETNYLHVALYVMIAIAVVVLLIVLL